MRIGIIGTGRVARALGPAWAAAGHDVALITDGRFSGGSHGFLIGHIVPEAQEGGPIALVQDGDEITIDAESRELNLHLSEQEMEKRRKEWKAPPLKYQKGTLYKYAKNVKYASHGAITDVYKSKYRLNLTTTVSGCRLV